MLAGGAGARDVRDRRGRRRSSWVDGSPTGSGARTRSGSRCSARRSSRCCCGRRPACSMIYALMLLLALVAEMHRPAASALIADLVPSEQRVAAFAVFRLAINVGWACGLTLGGLLADRSFSYLFIGDAATSAAFGVISLIALPHGTRTSRHEERHLTGRDPRDRGRSRVPPVPRLGPDRRVDLHAERGDVPAARPGGRLLHVGLRRPPGAERHHRGPARAPDHLVDGAAIANADGRARHAAGGRWRSPPWWSRSRSRRSR